MERYVAKPEQFPEGVGDGQGVGDVERGAAPRQVGDGKGQSRGRLQDQEMVQEVGEDEG